MDNKTNSDYRTGELPLHAPLASAYIPMQEKAEPRYQTQTAIARGTLFPGLDLPFRGMVNLPLPATPLGELMAIDFAADELSLYLDTHPEDQEAFDAFQSMLSLSREARERYETICGSVTKKDMLDMKDYAWLKGLWPWELCKEGED